MADAVINKRKPHLWWNQPWALESEKRYGRAVEGGGIRLRRDRLDCPLHWRKPRVVAVWNDLLHDDVPFDFLRSAVATMRACGDHTFLVLTKREDNLGRLRGMLPGNVWLGTTVESNDYLSRVKELVKTPAAVRWLNAHLLGPLDLNRRPGGSSDPRSYLPERAYAGLDGWYCVVCKQWVPYTERKQDHACDDARVRWVAIECNRPFRGDPKEWWGWCCDLVDQCVMKGVPVWVKQGPTAAGRVSHDYADFPEWARRREFPNQEQADAQE